MKIRMNKLLLSALIVAGSAALHSCSDEWDDHYSDSGINASGKTILAELKANPEFSKFTEILERTGNSKLLSGNRAYTVFAPTNDAMAGYTPAQGYDEAESFVKNHIAYFSHAVSAYSDTTVTMMNDKVMRIRNARFGDNQNPEIPVVEGNIACRNGLIHGIQGIAPYIPNLWETIAGEAPVFSDSLHKRDSYILNTTESTIDSINDEGNTVFLDSVVTYTNDNWSYMGQLNAEDSAYASVILTDPAWEEALAQVEKDFMYEPEIQYENYWTGGVAAKDSLLSFKKEAINATILSALTYRLPFVEQLLRDEYKPESDFIESVGGFDRVPKASLKTWLEKIIAEGKEKKASNGVAYLASSFDLKNYEINQIDTIKVECENENRIVQLGNAMMTSTTTRLNADIPYTTMENDNDKVEFYTPKTLPNGELEKHEVSSSQFLTVGQAPSGPASLTYGVSGTLSTAYDVWVSFIPPSAVPGVIDVKPLVATVNTTYTSMRNGNMRRVTFRTQSFNLDPNAVTKVKVASAIEVAPCWYGFLDDIESLYETESESWFQRKYGVQIEIRNDTKLAETDKDHNLYIDRIELVPHRED